MSDGATLTPPERFNRLIEGLFGDVATRVANAWVPLAPAQLVLIKLIWRRLRRMRRRFAAIVAQLRAGTLAQAGPQAGPQADGTPDRPAAAPPAGSSHRPRPPQPSRCFGWVICAVSWFVNVRRCELAEMLDDPEMVALVADAPQLGRELRPLCQMLAVKQPAWLRRPRRRAVKPPPPPAPDWAINAPGAILKPDGTVWQRWGASTLWRPGDPGTLEEAQKFDRPRRIWPRD